VTGVQTCALPISCAPRPLCASRLSFLLSATRAPRGDRCAGYSRWRKRWKKIPRSSPSPSSPDFPTPTSPRRASASMWSPTATRLSLTGSPISSPTARGSIVTSSCTADCPCARRSRAPSRRRASPSCSPTWPTTRGAARRETGRRGCASSCGWAPAPRASRASGIPTRVPGARGGEAGVGASVTIDVGGKVDQRHGAPLRVAGLGRTRSAGRFVHRGPMARGLPGRLGTTAVLDVNDVKVILISYRWQTLDPEMIRFVGLDPLDHKILVVKSTIHYRAAFEPIAHEIIEVDAPGLSSSNLARFDFQRIRRPIFPLDPDTRYPCGGPGMAFPGFTPADFKVFDIDGFTPRMEAIRTRIRPKLEAIGRDLLPDVGRIAGDQAFAHVAKHVRRTVNPPDDTWVAFALDKRGYKKHCHFKIAVSRGAVRFLFEAGPEHAGKK